MCGLTGFFTHCSAHRDDAMDRTIASMTATLAHRGPDASGIWMDVDAGIALGHRRLSIVDLSVRGQQPMHSAAGRYVISYNGEIYNHAQLRAQLPGHGFRGGSDTEVLLAAIEAWGLDITLSRANGMFAFALWDREQRCLQLVRDRLGKKPLYYGWSGPTLVFGSELIALRAFPNFSATINRKSLATYLRHDYVPAPLSIFEGIYKLRAGTCLAIRAGDPVTASGHNPLLAQRKYWDARVQLQAAQAQPNPANAATMVGELDTLLADAVRLRMQADVPLGAFLSGGTDSSTVVALMQAQSAQRVQTFSIGFDDPRHDEAGYAKQVATILGTAHTELYISGADALAVVPQLPRIFDEPFADSSQIPFYLVAALARRQVTVAVSGDGGDELFFGYPRYQRALQVHRWQRWLPRWVGEILADLIDVAGDQEVRYEKRIRAADELRAANLSEVYLNRVSHWRRPHSVVLQASGDCSAFSAIEHLDRDDPQQLMYLDLLTYLPEDILTKVDRATMAVGLEARAPLLDYRVVEYAWRVPFELKRRDGQNKWLLKELLRRYLPAPLVDRGKKGFGAPVGAWLRGPLRDWVEALLDQQRLRSEGYFEPSIIGTLWQNFLQGNTGLHKRLWSVLMFQAWLDENRSTASDHALRSFHTTAMQPPAISPPGRPRAAV